MTTTNPYKTVNIDPDDVEAIDRFIDEMILSGDQFQLCEGRGSAKTTLTLIVFCKILDRCIERNLFAKSYKHTSIKKMRAQILKYTGDVIQQEYIKQWMPDRKFYFCYNEVTQQDELFCPGLPSTQTAKPGDYLVLTTAGGFCVIKEKEFKTDWEEVDE
jgi:hypothetical protein